jgi:hypothetical protein
MAHVTGYDPRDRRAERRTQIAIAVIAALSGIAVAGIGLIGTLRATNSQIVTGPAPAGSTVTQTVTVGPTATVTETISSDGGGGDDSTPGSNEPSPSKTALDVSWATDASEFANDPGSTVLFNCPPRGVVREISGDRLYHYQSSVCTAGVHDGRITVRKGGRLIVLIREGALKYPSARRNGITSQEHGTGDASFEFLPAR